MGDRISDDWKGKEYAFFSHKRCECFPCHETDDPNNFNCIFCYCPLYSLGENCGGDFIYSESGIKDCSKCLYPHIRENYGEVVRRAPLIRNPKNINLE